MRALLLILLVLPLAGCAQLDDAKQAAADAEAKLADAQREAQEARDRYERVRSATIVRSELVNAGATPIIENGTLRFAVTARRGDVAIPPANLTAIEPLWIMHDGLRFACDPLTCEITLPPEGVDVYWTEAEVPQHVPGPTVCILRPAGEGESCGQAPIAGQSVRAKITTAVSDVTQ